MNIVDNIMDSLKYPVGDWTKLLILAVISIIPIVNFASGGYWLRIIKSTFAGIDEVPDFDDFGELFIDGIKIIIVSIVYMIVPIIIFSVAVLPILLDPYGTAANIISWIIMFIGLIITIIMSLILIPAIVNMGIYDSELGAAFRFSEILGKIKEIGWGNYILWIIAIWIAELIVWVILAVLVFVLFITLIGIPVALILLFLAIPYFSMFPARSIGLLFADTLE